MSWKPERSTLRTTLASVATAGVLAAGAPVVGVTLGVDSGNEALAQTTAPKLIFSVDFLSPEARYYGEPVWSEGETPEPEVAKAVEDKYAELLWDIPAQSTEPYFDDNGNEYVPPMYNRKLDGLEMVPLNSLDPKYLTEFSRISGVPEGEIPETCSAFVPYRKPSMSSATLNYEPETEDANRSIATSPWNRWQEWKDAAPEGKLQIYYDGVKQINDFVENVWIPAYGNNFGGKEWVSQTAPFDAEWEAEFKNYFASKPDGVPNFISTYSAFPDAYAWGGVSDLSKISDPNALVGKWLSGEELALASALYGKIEVVDTGVASGQEYTDRYYVTSDPTAQSGPLLDSRQYMSNVSPSTTYSPFYTAGGQAIPQLSSSSMTWVVGVVLDPNARGCFVPRPAIDIEKYINGEDADEAPGVTVKPGEDMVIRFDITNTGNVPLRSVGVTDDKVNYRDIKCERAVPKAPEPVPGTGGPGNDIDMPDVDISEPKAPEPEGAPIGYMPVGSKTSCTATLKAPESGEHVNTGTAKDYSFPDVTDSDDAHATVETPAPTPETEETVAPTPETEEPVVEETTTPAPTTEPTPVTETQVVTTTVSGTPVTETVIVTKEPEVVHVTDTVKVTEEVVTVKDGVTTTETVVRDVPATETPTAAPTEAPAPAPKRVALAVTGTNANTVSVLAIALLALAGLALVMRRKA